MATESIHVSALIPASPEVVYEAWLSSELHTRMTGAGARIEPHVGGSHTAWDAYISGTTLELDPGKRIVQTWRSTQFPDGSGHSQIAVTFEEEGGHTRLHIAHTEIPEGQGAGYQSGWHDHYFGPMITYFAGAGAPTAAEETAPAPAASKAAARKPAAKKAPRKSVAKKAPKKSAAKKPAAKKAPRKSAAKKAARKPAKKAVGRRAAAKKTARKPAKKTATRK